MTRVVLSVVLVVALNTACGVVHMSDGGDVGMDAGLRDAGSTVDARPRDAPLSDDVTVDASTGIDAFICPDLDSDGALDAACGGADCDDTNPMIDGMRASCLDATTRRGCDGEVAVEATCPKATPACDGRTGECTLTACGDGVLHEGEICDDGNDVEADGCSSICGVDPCRNAADCPAAAPSCSHSDDGGNTFRCRTLDPDGASLATFCDTDAECASGFCDPRQGRCSVACLDDTDCDPALMGSCRPTQWRDDTRSICSWGCRSQRDCRSGTYCYLSMWGLLGDGFPSRCEPPVGDVELYGDCTWAWECSTNACGGECAYVCAALEDCAPEATMCWTPLDTPAGWPIAALGYCVVPPDRR